MNNGKKQRYRAICEISKGYVPVLVVDFSDHSHFTRAETTLDTIPLTISAKRRI